MNTFMNIVSWFGDWLWFVILPAAFFFVMVAIYSEVADYQEWRELVRQDAERDNDVKN